MSDHTSDARRALGDITADLARDGRWDPWPVPHMVGTTASTMADVARLAETAAPEGTTVVAEEQTAGRGRVGREWQSLPYAGLWLTILVRPTGDPSTLGWLPLVTGAAAARAIRSQTGLDVRLKWPNDVVLESANGIGKIGGILAERLADGAVLIGIGLNVDQHADELPPEGTSLRLHGAVVRREDLLVALLGEFAIAYRRWVAGSDPAPDYLAMSVTIGSDVRVQAPAGTCEGRATGLGPHGELLVVDGSGRTHAISAGDVLLVRPTIG